MPKFNYTVTYLNYLPTIARWGELRRDLLKPGVGIAGAAVIFSEMRAIEQAVMAYQESLPPMVSVPYSPYAEYQQ